MLIIMKVVIIGVIKLTNRKGSFIGSSNLRSVVAIQTNYSTLELHCQIAVLKYLMERLKMPCLEIKSSTLQMATIVEGFQKEVAISFGKLLVASYFMVWH